MAQAYSEQRPQETPELEMTDTTAAASSGSFKFNAHAPEFVPRMQTQVPISGYFYPCFHFLGGSGGSDWIYVGDQEPIQLISDSTVALPNYSKNVLTQDLHQKIIKQVEYQLSDMSLLANESLSKHMNKDSEGYVPIAVIASTKKIKSLISNHHLLAQVLRSSSNLVVSNDNKKVKRKHLFTDKDREELQSRTVVAENLPEDHSHHNLEKIFSVVGRVKTIRICHPQEPNSSRSKGDYVISNKIHALIEYETSEIADKAVEKLNDERNWRKGLRVRVLLRCSPKSVLKSRKSEFDGILDDCETPHESAEDSSLSHFSELIADNNDEENSAGTKKGFGRGRGKPRPRTQSQSHNGRCLLSPSPQSSGSIQFEASAKQTTKGPRMPDGTRGFTMGRGKPLTTTPVLGNSTLE
ncbi:La-related protein 6C [Camellia lanceoleosa]|uniref:La-related protein 6C n=1 Tax=Camellia lanceoleosa TaxID=1840588 RepID=A0ACC0II76_9ERIC|nr:La-related protein 6C [Camellia lanceoleosa]